MAEKKINFSIQEGDAFFAHEASINFNPTQFVLDFKSVTPRVDPRSNEGQVISIKHNVIILDVFHAKKFVEFMKNRIDDYEKEFGKIEKPKAIANLEKKKKVSKDEKKEGNIPNYFG